MNDIINLFTKEHGNYNDLFKFKTLLIFITIVVIFTKFNFFSKSIFLLLAVVLAVYLTNIYVTVVQNDLSDSNNIIYYKLESLQTTVYNYLHYKVSISSVGEQKLSSQDIDSLYKKNKLDSLYIDANMIEFLYSIIKLYDYNPSEFYLLLKGTNNILRLRKEIEQFYESNSTYPENIHEMVQIAMDLKVNCINNLQNFIYSVPKTNSLYTYINDSINTYTILINKNLSKIQTYSKDYIKRNGVNSNTVFIDIHSTKPFDALTNHSIIPGKYNNNTLIDLYV